MAKITQPVNVVFLSAGKPVYQRYQQLKQRIKTLIDIPCLVSVALLSSQHDRVYRNLKKSERAARARFNQKIVQDFDAISSVQNTLRHFKTVFLVSEIEQKTMSNTNSQRRTRAKIVKDYKVQLH